MLHAFQTPDFLRSIEDFDHHARQGHAHARSRGNSCGKGGGAPARIRAYPALGSAEAALAVCRDLWSMGQNGSGRLVAVFNGPALQSAESFDALLWRHLQTMHGVDAACFDWHGGSRMDPSHRVFSIGGRRWHYQAVTPQTPDQFPRLIFQAQGD